MAWTQRFTGPEPIRLNKWLAQEGVCSRREAEALIAAGRVQVDGQKVGDPGHKVAPGQAVVVDVPGNDGAGSRAPCLGFTAVLNKPVGYVSAQPERGQIPAARLIQASTRFGGSGDVPGPERRLAPLGRLDMDSRGLLLLSEDGVLAKAVIGPESQLDKEYRVVVTGTITEAKLRLLRHGLSLDGRVLKPAIVTLLAPQTLRFVLREGRNRQIRRMAEAVGLRVIDLQRLRIGSLQLDDLPEGQWRPLHPEERAALIAASKAKPVRPMRTGPSAR